MTAEGAYEVSPDDVMRRSAGRADGFPNSAAGRLAEVMSRGEAALLSGDPDRRAAWFRDVEAAEREVHAARTAPPWEVLLTDPTSQPMGAGAVTASILAYQEAASNTPCACGGTLHKTCAEGHACPATWTVTSAWSTGAVSCSKPRNHDGLHEGVFDGDVWRKGGDRG